ncbi:Protein of unknown function [Variovorax sp. HW608]|uniref:DUF3577 domain-containing protein n=1 Tax=Variovorax sp. HW608 TaxID=1034889 RepID=UPI00081FB7F4|nr:DUF3577 domain-containing protein [Variovorax sp. HW608]SCK28569.1 Protein of unknown function [Variovorax sp. HW608]
MANHVQPQAQGAEYFNLHVSGIGYLNRIRWVETRRGGRRADPFLSCSINALHGSSDDPNRTYFDVKVSGEDAIALIEELKPAVDAGSKVLVSFKLGDIYPHLYERKVRDPQGRDTGQFEHATLIKGRLILINTAKVDGELVYRRETDADEAQPAQQLEADDALAPEAVEHAPAPAQQRTQRVAPRQPIERPQGRSEQNRSQASRRTSQYEEA